MQDASPLIFLVLLIGIFYFMLIRPQKKRVEEHRKLISSISIGDEVVTIGGIYGTVRQIGDEDCELEISPGTTVTFAKTAIARRQAAELPETSEEQEE
ncbi:MAG: preprotein translocase subunit YajC [Actinomycetota bacterium]|nr:preprotein translocase subunit YajC [Actinomycetota bacterium]